MKGVGFLSKLKNILMYAGIPIVIVAVVLTMYNLSETNTKKNYSAIVEMFSKNEVKKFELNLSSGEMVYELRNKPNDALKYNVPNVSLFMEDVNEIITENNKKYPNGTPQNIEYNFKPGNEASWFVNLLPTALLIGVLVVIWVLFMRRIGKSSMLPTTDEKRRLPMWLVPTKKRKSSAKSFSS